MKNRPVQLLILAGFSAVTFLTQVPNLTADEQDQNKFKQSFAANPQTQVDPGFAPGNAVPLNFNKVLPDQRGPTQGGLGPMPGDNFRKGQGESVDQFLKNPVMQQEHNKKIDAAFGKVERGPQVLWLPPGGISKKDDTFLKIGDIKGESKTTGRFLKAEGTSGDFIKLGDNKGEFTSKWKGDYDKAEGTSGNFIKLGDNKGESKTTGRFLKAEGTSGDFIKLGDNKGEENRHKGDIETDSFQKDDEKGNQDKRRKHDFTGIVTLVR